MPTYQMIIIASFVIMAVGIIFAIMNRTLLTILFLAVGVLIFTLGLMMSPYKGKSKQPESETEPKIITDVSFDQIYQDYDQNELAAKDKYSGNWYQITAEINNIYQGNLIELFSPKMTLVRKVGNTYVYFHAVFDKDDEEAIKQLKTGETITFTGKCSSDAYWEQCRLVR